MFLKKESDFEKLEGLFCEFVDKYDIEGLEEILYNLDNPEKLSYRDEILNYHTSPVCRDPYIHTYFNQIRNKIFKKDYADFLRYVYGIRLRRIAVDTLPKELGSYAAIIRVFTNLPKGWPFTKINRYEFESLYLLLEKLYFIQSGHKLGVDDLFNIYFSGLDERLVFFLDDFDTADDKDIPQPSKDYFKTLRNVKYYNKTIQNMEQDLRYLIITALRYYSPIEKLSGWQIDTIKTLIFCSAVSDGRKIIVRDDIVNAFNTYFKLLNTDITKYKARQEVINSTDYDSLKAKWTFYTLKFAHTITPY